MIVPVIPFHAADAHLALELVRWIGKLGSVAEFDCVLVVDCSTPIDITIAVKEEAEKVFKSAPLVTNAASVSGWIAGANSLWYRALDWAAENGRSILWLEPDSAPLRPGWLQELDAAYSACDTTHMGHIVETKNTMLPPRCMSGVAVYGPEAARWPRPPQGQPFNVFFADLLLKNAADTKLIKDFFGQRNLPPVFVAHEQPDEPAHHFMLDWLPAAAVLFHRDKTHSLIPLLAEKLGIDWQRPPPAPEVEQPRLAVVFPVHSGDIHLAIHHALWLRKMGVRWPNHAVIAHDPSTPRSALVQLHAHLSQCFAKVEAWQYGAPPIRHYPWAANYAFQATAHHMFEQDSPWLWCEADGILLTPDALEKLEAEYYRAGKAFMGAVVPHLNHLQGTAIYPADSAARMPRTMGTLDGAFDMHREDTEHDRHDASHLFCHVWSLVGRMACPTGGGEIPARITANELRQWLPKTSVFLHRVKDTSVLNLLLTGQYRHA